MASIRIVSTTESTIKVRMVALDSNYGSSDRVCEWSIDGVVKGIVSLGARISSGGDYTFTRLRPGVEYSIAAYIYSPNWTDPPGYDFFETAATDENEPVEPWYWDRSNGSASAYQTRMSYTAITNKGKLSDFSYLVWNDLVDKTQEVLDANGYRWSNNYGSYNDAKMSYADKNMTAERFNAVWYNIDRYSSTGIRQAVSGEKIYGWYFTTLTDCLNRLI